MSVLEKKKQMSQIRLLFDLQNPFVSGSRASNCSQLDARRHDGGTGPSRIIFPLPPELRGMGAATDGAGAEEAKK